MSQTAQLLNKVAVVVDSAASLPDYVASHKLIHVAPLRISVNGRNFADGVDITPSQFYSALQNSSKVPTTSAPSIQSFIECFEKSLEIAESVLCITVSRKFSSSPDVARVAANQFSQRLGDNGVIRVLDSGAASGAEGLVATEALRRAELGLNIEEVLQFSQKIAERVSLLAFPETLFYLWKSGRIPRIAHIGSSILDIKPIFEMKHGEVESVARVRTRTKAIQRLVDTICERSSNPIHFTVIHSNCKDDAENLLAILSENCDTRESFISEFTPAMGSHIGPGLLGVAFWHE